MNIRETINKVIKSFLDESTFKLIDPKFLDKMKKIPDEVKQKNFDLERTFGKEARLKQVPDFMQPHVELAYALKHRQLSNIGRLTFKNSYYFPIRTRFKNNVTEGLLRISNHKANLSVLSTKNKDKDVINVLSIVLMDNDRTRPENTFKNKVYLDELHFNQCSDEDMERLLNVLVNYVNGSVVYNMGSGLFNIRPRRRSNCDAKYFDIDAAIADKKEELSKPSEVQKTIMAEPEIVNDKQEEPQFSPKEVERDKTKILTRSERIQMTKTRNRARQENYNNEVQKRNDKLNTLMDRVKSVHTIEYSLDSKGNVTEFYVDAIPYDINNTITQKVPVGKVTRTFVVPTQENNRERPEFGTYHYYINGLPYFTLKVELGHGYPKCTASNNKADFSTLMEKIIFEEIRKEL